jgi:hypothetical protein
MYPQDVDLLGVSLGCIFHEENGELEKEPAI